MPRPLIIVTNDDGIKSPGLAAAVNALRGLGEIVVVAPREQQSSSGRAFFWKTGTGRKYRFRLGGRIFPAYAVDASPAVTVRYALQLVARRTPALLVSGVNYGENMGSGLTISGTVGAALEAAASGVPALAVSLQTATEFHTSHSKRIDFAVAAYFARFFAKRLLGLKLPHDAHLLNVNVPAGAHRKTPWRVTRASSQAYYQSIVNRGRFAGYDVNVRFETLEPDSDIYAVLVDQVVSATLLTYDLTARMRLPQVAKVLNGAHG